MVLFPMCCILLMFFMLLSCFSLSIKASFNLTLPHQHPHPQIVVDELQWKVNASLSRRELHDQACLTGNPIDDCWRCDPNWAANRQRLADCGVGFGRDALGGKGGQIYIVTDSTDSDPSNPTPGTLRHAVIQDVPLWIVFSDDMTINLKHELIFNSYKTVDGRGANVHVTGNGCITLQHITNVIIHNIHVHDCKPSGNTKIRSSPTQVVARGESDGDGITISSGQKIWIDHCSLYSCTDGLIDVIKGSTGITVSNSYFAKHDKVMLLGHDDGYMDDKGMQVTVAFNHFGKGLVQRMPRGRHGYIHVVNNDYTKWEMYAIGGSAAPTFNSQGNRYTAPSDPNSKEVTKRVDTKESVWSEWNWKTEGDIMVNGAFFVPSGSGSSDQYAKATSQQAKSASQIDQLTMYSGVFGDLRDNGDSNPGSNGGETVTGSTNGNDATGSGSGEDWNFRMKYGGGSSQATPPSPTSLILFVSTFYLLIILILDTRTNHVILLSLLWP